EEGHDEEEEEDELYRDVNINLGRGIQMGDVHQTQEFKDSHVTLTLVNPDGQQQILSVSSQFVTSMLNPTPDAGMESILKTTSQMDVQTLTSVAPLPMSAPNLTPSTIATITLTQQAPNPPTTALSSLIQNLPDFSSLFGFDNRLKTLEEKVKEQVKVQVSKILPKIEQTVNEQLEAEVLTQSSNSSKTSYAVAADLSEMELKKILIEKMEGNKSIHRSNEQRNLYKALVEIIRKHGCGYLQEIVVRIANNDLYRLKEGDFSCLRIKDIEDMLLLVVQKRLINLSPDDVSDFTIALRMFTRSLVIQNGRNRLMRLDELYKFSDGTLTRLQTSLERFNTTAGNPVKEILLKLNIPDHRPILTNSKVTLTKHRQMTKPYSSPRFIANYFILGIYKDGRGGSEPTVKKHVVETSEAKASADKPKDGNQQLDLQEKGVIDSGCSRHMTGNMSYITYYKEFDGGYVAFEGNPKGGKNTDKGTIRTGKLDFENVYFVKDLKFNLFSVSQMYDKKNSVLFTDTECVVLSPDFKLTNENHVLLRVSRKNMYSVDLKNIISKGGLTCLFAKATTNESRLWHRRLGHLHFKTMNKLVKGNLARDLPSKIFENEQICVACQKGKQHRASCKTKTENSISLPLHMLHMDLFGPTFIKSLMKMMYFLVVTDDYSRFTWAFFLFAKDETSGIFKSFITRIENPVDHKYSVARTPQQNGVAERRNTTLIKAAKTMLVDSKLHTTFWAKAVNTACYVQNRVLLTKPHNKTPYELLHGRTPALSFMRPFGCHVTILNTIDQLGKFDGKANEGFFVGYSLNSKAFRVFNSKTRIVEETLHIREEPKSSQDDGFKPSNDVGNKVNKVPRQENDCKDQEEKDSFNSPNRVNAVSSTVNAVSNEVNAVGRKSSIELLDDPNMPKLEDISIFKDLNEDVFGVEANLNNLKSTFQRDCDKEQGKIGGSGTQKKGIDYDEVFAPVTRIKAIRLSIAYASFKDFVVYQMDMKSAFLYGKIKEEVYVCQPLGFEDVDFPNKVYKVEKVLYGLHQAPRAWYETLSTYLLDNGFPRRKIDKTLFIRRYKGDILLVQVYVDDIIFDNGFPRRKIDKTLFIRRCKGDILLCKKQTVVANSTTEAEYVAAYSCCGQCKKKTVVANSTTEAEYVAAYSCCGQVLWIQDQLLDYGDSLLAGVNIPRSDEDRLKHIELMKLYTTLQKKVLDIEDELKRTKTAQQTKIDGLERRVKKLEKKHRSRTHKLNRLYKVGLIDRVISSSDDEALDKEDTSKQGRIYEIDADEDIALPRALKNKSFAEIKESFDKAMKRIHNFIDFRTELVEVSTKKDKAKTIQESSSKRPRDELDQERSKKQKVEDDKESAELK
nr:retrovirus-related Pol polyprotein from transposon TNT 1-94 [Tanacetum cinerariifolium]